MMKRLLIAALVIVFAASLFGCSSGGSSNSKPSITEPSSASVESKGGSEGNTESATANKQPTGSAQVDETVLVDESGIRITTTGLGNGYGGKSLKLLIENNSGEGLIFQCRNASINGYMVDTMFSSNVADGKKAKDAITFVKSSLELSDIDAIADIELTFHIFSSDNWSTYLDTEPVTLRTSIADEYNYEYDDSGAMLYDDEGLQIIVKGLSKNASYLGPSVIVEIINNRDNCVTVQTRDASVNGYMVDPIFSPEIMPGKRIIATMDFMSSSLKENDIDNIEDVSLYFHVFDSDTWETIVDTDMLSFSF
ncbi:MAG: hypothetical protein Q4D34_07920 [Eggerthellaceae bacterium]|nr:hypothetical protein [Eggerthellaceae bacterium]